MGRAVERRNNRLNSGEALVEVIVSFSVVLVLLFAVTTMIRAASAMSGRAFQKGIELERAATAAELGNGTTLGEGTVEITVEGRVITVPIWVKESGPLKYFVGK